LLRVLELPAGAIWEPACGRGAIANVLRAHGHSVVCTDLVDYAADPAAIYGVDFLKTTELPPGVTCILTNPPFKIHRARPRVVRACDHVRAAGPLGIRAPVIDS